MLNEWSDRAPDPGKRPWAVWIIATLTALAMLAQLATCVAGLV